MPKFADPEDAYRAARSKILLAEKDRMAVLRLSDWGLTVLPPEIGNCRDLRSVYLDRNNLTSLPASLAKCEQLSLLDLRGNKLCAIPVALSSCRKLSHLSLGANMFCGFPQPVLALPYLERLELHDNALKELPEGISQMGALSVLDIADNDLSNLPKGLQSLVYLKRLWLHGNDGLQLPPDVLGPSKAELDGFALEPVSAKSILDYYFSRRPAGDRPLNEVKLVLVGRGGAGKTSLVERLVWDKFDPAQKETLGVKLCDWRLRDCDGGEVLAHVWDFAGQTITHSMHQFFLSVRTVYVLVLTGRENSEKEDAEYWLRLIAAFGTSRERAGFFQNVEDVGPPVIVALNKWDDSGSAHAKLDRRALKERYPFIVDFVETDCATKTGIAKLRDLLHTTVDSLQWVRAPFPEIYRKVKSKLEAEENPHLPYDAYRRICVECGVTDQEKQDLLAENLHALGVALNFCSDDRLRFASVLKPHWLTEHVYALVRHAEQKAGVLHRAALPTVLADEKEARMRQFLVDMMVRFELAYPLAEDDATPVQWLVPQALPDTQPEGVENFSAEKDATRLRYTYRALPVSIVPRFIVRTHPFIEGELRWASGVVLTLGGARALIRADYVEKQVEITATGPTEARRELAGLAQREFRFINGQISGLNPTEEMLVEGTWVPVRTLEADEKKKDGVTGVATDAGTRMVKSAEKLNELSEEAARDDSWKPRIFISYSHTDEAQRKKLELYLKVLATHGVLHEKWDDRKIQPGEDWDRSIKRELEDADVVLLLVSTEALASHYIQTVEMKRALEREAAGECVVVPIILEHCDWKLPELRKLQALPTAAKPVRDWTPQLKGWKDVSDGLRKVFERLRTKHPAG
jgi:internalin A